MSCGERELRKKTSDETLTAKMRHAKQTVRCRNGHLNSKTATFCWKCGERLGGDQP